MAQEFREVVTGLQTEVFGCWLDAGSCSDVNELHKGVAVKMCCLADAINVCGY
jgi:hypothetical protein